MLSALVYVEQIILTVTHVPHYLNNQDIHNSPIDDDDEADFNTFLHCGVDDEAIECLNYNNFMANATQTFIICT